MYDELYEIFGDSDRPATFADTLRMKYLERVILESLRMYPPVPIIARKLNRDVKIGKSNNSTNSKIIVYLIEVNYVNYLTFWSLFIQLADLLSW